MDYTGRFMTLSKDYSTGKFLASLQVNEDVTQTFETLKDCDMIDIALKKHRKKRSLDANAYYWLLVGKLANELGQSNAWIHNHMLRRYGQIEIIDGKAVYIVLPDTEDAENHINEAETYHLKPTSQVKHGKDGMYRTYMMLRGSSTYDTKEMSWLINGIVDSCKEIGIETLPPEELERMMILYEKHSTGR